MESVIHNVIDAHTHVFPDKVAEKSREFVGSFYNLPMYTCGTASELKKVSDGSRTINGRTYRISHQLVCSPAVTAAQTGSINRYISGLVSENSSLIGFGTLHPENSDFEDIIDGIAASGLKGIKFHPDFQQFSIDDKNMYPVYRYAAKKGLPILFHMGDMKLDYSSPHRLARVVGDIPELKVIAAHMGGYSHWDEAIDLPVSENLYFDISSTLSFMPKEQFMRFIEKFGYTRFFFGSDFPMWEPYGELEKFLSLGYDENVQRAIEFDNFADLIGLRQS